MRIRPVSDIEANIEANIEAETELLSLPRTGRLSAAKGSLCGNRPIRQDYLDQFVWNEIIRLLEDSTLIQTEIDRCREMARSADPLRRREEKLRRERARLDRNMERIITAYQEGLVTLAQLRQRMPGLRKYAQATESEFHSLPMAAMDEAKYLQLAETLTGFRAKLRSRAETLEVRERQQIPRLIVKEILVGTDRITLAIRFRFRSPDRGRMDRPLRDSVRLDRRSIKVIFCVRGVISPMLANHVPARHAGICAGAVRQLAVLPRYNARQLNSQLWLRTRAALGCSSEDRHIAGPGNYVSVQLR